MYKIIIALGVLPLLGITAIGGCELATELFAPSNDLVVEESFNETVVVPSTILVDNDATESKKLFEWVSESTCAPFSTNALNSLNLVREPEKEVQRAWNEHADELQVIEDCVSQLSVFHSRKMQMNRAQLIQASTSLKESHRRIKESVQANRLSDVARSADHLESLAIELDEIILQKEYDEFNQVIFSRVRRKILTATTADEFQDILDDLSELKGKLSPETLTMVSSCEFQRDAVGLNRRLNSAISDFGTETVIDLNGLVREFKTLESQYDDSIPPRGEDAKRLNRLKETSRVVEGLAKVEVLGEPEVDRLENWVREAKLIIEEFDNETVRTSVSKMIQNMIDSRLPIKSSAANSRLQYVTELGSGKVIEGVFRDAGSRYLPEDGSPGLRKLHYGAPQPVPEIKSVEIYNSIRLELMQGITTKSFWVQLKSNCDKLSDEANAYKGATKSASFTDEAEFAQYVISNWGELDALFSLLKN